MILFSNFKCLAEASISKATILKSKEGNTWNTDNLPIFIAIDILICRRKDKNGVPQRAKSGVAVIAKATNASVLPCAIYCDGPIKPGKKVVVTYGKLLSLSDMGLDKEECGPHDIKDAANKVMGSIFDLWEASAQ